MLGNTLCRVRLMACILSCFGLSPTPQALDRTVADHSFGRVNRIQYVVDQAHLTKASKHEKLFRSMTLSIRCPKGFPGQRPLACIQRRHKVRISTVQLSANFKISET